MLYTLDTVDTNIEHKSTEVIMATAAAAGVGRLETGEVFSVVLGRSACSRCGGFMVNDLSMAVLHSTSDLEFVAKRCVQCGEVVDPVIERNRRVRQEGEAIRPLGRSVHSRACQVRS